MDITKRRGGSSHDFDWWENQDSRKRPTIQRTAYSYKKGTITFQKAAPSHEKTEGKCVHCARIHCKVFNFKKEVVRG